MNVLTEQLKYTLELAQQLPDASQNALAERILEEIKEQEWNQIISKPHVQQKMLTLAEKAWKEHVVGETEEEV